MSNKSSDVTYEAALVTICETGPEICGQVSTKGVLEDLCVVTGYPYWRRKSHLSPVAKIRSAGGQRERWIITLSLD